VIVQVNEFPLEVIMKQLLMIPRLTAGKAGYLAAMAGLGALVYFSISPSLLRAAQVRVRDGQIVRLKLHNVITTENVEKGDTIEFDVADDVVVDGHTVIAKGAPAHGKVVRVKGAGKRRAKDASVTFQFVDVRAADNQAVPIRKNPYKAKKKGESKENEIEANEVIPGQVERVIGADKGKEYVAYTDAAVIVNAPETAPVPVSPPAVAPPLAPQVPAQPQPQPGPTLAAPEQEPAAIDFASDPTGADIYIDGSFKGNTPSTLQVAAGRHAIDIRFAGYRGYSRTIVVDPGSHPTVHATLEKE
jgi:hypothetical protein